MHNQEMHDAEARPERELQVASTRERSSTRRPCVRLRSKIGPLNAPFWSDFVLEAYQRTSCEKSDYQKIEKRSENAPKTDRFCEQSLTCAKHQLLKIRKFRIYRRVGRVKFKIVPKIANFSPTEEAQPERELQVASTPEHPNVRSRIEGYPGTSPTASCGPPDAYDHLPAHPLFSTFRYKMGQKQNVSSVRPLPINHLHRAVPDTRTKNPFPRRSSRSNKAHSPDRPPRIRKGLEPSGRFRVSGPYAVDRN
jgi:hypothetical protein